MDAMKAFNLGLRFLLELCLLAALAGWGLTLAAPLGIRLAVGLGTPLAAAVVWGRWVAPAARRRLAGRALLAVEVILFALGVAALFAAGEPGLGIALGLIYVANKTVSLILGQ